MNAVTLPIPHPLIASKDRIHSSSAGRDASCRQSHYLAIPAVIGAARYLGAAFVHLAVLAPLALIGSERKKVTMSTSVIGLSIDCADPIALALFWSEALGRPVNPGANAESAAIDATDPASGPRLAFHLVPEPKTVKNRLHLDLRTDQYEAESKRLISLGATPIREIEKPAARWTTFADPEGNEFDLVTALPATPRPGEYVPSPSERVRD
jgi:hypothetical protein